MPPGRALASPSVATPSAAARLPVPPTITLCVWLRLDATGPGETITVEHGGRFGAVIEAVTTVFRDLGYRRIEGAYQVWAAGCCPAVLLPSTHCPPPPSAPR